MSNLLSILKNTFRRENLLPLVIVFIVIVFSAINLFNSADNPLNSAPQISPTPTLTSLNKYTIVPSIQTLRNQTFAKISLSDNFVYPNIPTSLYIYSARIENKDFRDLARQLATDFKLQPDPTRPYQWTNAKKTEYLMINPQNNQLEYYQAKGAAPIGRIDVQKSINTANQLLSKYPHLNELKLNPNNINFFTGGPLASEYSVSTVDNANLVDLNYSSVILDYPVLIESENIPTATLLLDSTGTIIQMRVSPRFLRIDTEPQKVIPLPQSEVETQVLQGNGSLVNSDVSQLLSSKLEKYLVFQSGSVEYRFNQSQLLLIPYLKFAGFIHAADLRQQVPTQVILPLVNP